MIGCPSCGAAMSLPAPADCTEPDRHADPRLEAATAWLFRYIMRSERRPPRDVAWPDDCPDHFRENWRRAATDMLAAIDHPLFDILVAVAASTDESLIDGQDERLDRLHNDGTLRLVGDGTPSGEYLTDLTPDARQGIAALIEEWPDA